MSGHTRLVLVPETVADHQTRNLNALETLVSSVEGGADLVLAKIQGVSHGGGIQVPAGTDDFANMERLVRLLAGGGGSQGLSPEQLFDGVGMASPAKTLRRAALLFAGRIPTQAEINSVSDGREGSLRRAIRALMQGAGFHAFLLRAANDRLLTDRGLDGESIDLAFDTFLPEGVNIHWNLAEEALNNGHTNLYEYPPFNKWRNETLIGFARAPVELIAHVVENDLPYTEILTADYIMANPQAAAAYGADTAFTDKDDPLEFRPSRMASYYRRDDSVVLDKSRGHYRVINPGNLGTDYPHAGILNTTLFLVRYPTTATNRNRARSRWTYYFFLGVDIEKSASRTTDPVALADTDNPTLKNPACTVCHVIMDPVAGTYQNYGEKFYRDEYGGLDSLAGLYKYPEDGSNTPYRKGDTWYRDMREPGFGGEPAPNADNSLQWLAQKIVADERFAEAAVKFWWPAITGREVASPPEGANDAGFEGALLASASQAAEVSRIAKAFRSGIANGRPYNGRDLLTEIVLSPWFRAESLAVSNPVQREALRHAGAERLLTPEELELKTEAITGYAWGRRKARWQSRGMIVGYLTAHSGTYKLLYGGIDSDGITTRTGDMTPLMAGVAQSHAIQAACPITHKELYVASDPERRLFGGIDLAIAPSSGQDGQRTFDVSRSVEEGFAAHSLAVQVAGTGPERLQVSFINDYYVDGHDRNLFLQRVVIRTSNGSVAATLDAQDSWDPASTCGGKDGRRNAVNLWSNCTISFELEPLAPGNYTIDLLAAQEAAGGEDARMDVRLVFDPSTSHGGLVIRRKIAELYGKLLGVDASPDSLEVLEAYALFRESASLYRERHGVSYTSGGVCRWTGDHYFYEGVPGNPLSFDSEGNSQLDWEHFKASPIGELLGNSPDPLGTGRAWAVVLAYLMTDYRYLYL